MKELFNKYKGLFFELFRFVLVGVIATGIDFLVYYLFHDLILPKDMMWGSYNLTTGIATTLGFIVSVIANYLLSIIFVFKNVKDKKKVKTISSAILFIFLSFIGLVLGLFIMQIGTEYLNWNDKIVFIIKTLIVLIWNYISRKLFIFKS